MKSILLSFLLATPPQSTLDKPVWVVTTVRTAPIQQPKVIVVQPRTTTTIIRRPVKLQNCPNGVCPVVR